MLLNMIRNRRARMTRMARACDSRSRRRGRITRGEGGGGGIRRRRDMHIVLSGNQMHHLVKMKGLPPSLSELL